MRACFLGQNVCALGYGVAMIQISLPEEKPPAEIIFVSDAASAIPQPAPANRMFAELKRQPHYS